jgi:GDP/UDP-N,N'-diacetylbacillosamine 2-epimerase (hydrolysing)
LSSGNGARAPRTIAIITGSRGEYGYIRPIVHEIMATDGLDYALIATNLHLLPDFGLSIQEFERDGLRISDRIYMALDGYTPASMAKSLGVCLMSLTDALVRINPTITLLAGDRGEQLMAAIASAHMNIPVAHIQAGELSGNIDGVTRHAIARFAHIHFPANDDAAERLRRSGEEDFRIFLTGAPQLDELVNGEYALPEEVASALGLELDKPILLLVQHPVTEEYSEACAQVITTIEAIAELGHQTVVVFPNNDAGSEEIRRVIEYNRASFMRVERNLPRRMYLGIMRVAAAMVGNSSSGLIEAPVFRLPAVNVGTRQRDRYRGMNVIDVPIDRTAIRDAIQRAVSPEFRASLANGRQPYLSDGKVSRRIVQILRDIKIDEHLLKKQLTY